MRFVFLLASFFIFTACAPAEHDLGSSVNSTLSGGVVMTANPTLEAQAIGVLASKCENCHGTNGMGGVSNITDKISLYRQGLIVPGEGTKGALVSSVSPGGNMPMSSSPITAQELKSIEVWINSMQVVPTRPTPQPPTPPEPKPTPTPPVPTPQPSPQPLPQPSTVTFSFIEANILRPLCVRCHGDMGSYSGTMAYVNTANPASSSLYSACKNGSMPRGGAPLTTAQLNAILTWIQNGASNN